MLTGEFRGQWKYVEKGCLTSLQVKNPINENDHLYHLLVSDP